VSLRRRDGSQLRKLAQQLHRPGLATEHAQPDDRPREQALDVLRDRKEQAAAELWRERLWEDAPLGAALGLPLEACEPGNVDAHGCDIERGDANGAAVPARERLRSTEWLCRQALRDEHVALAAEDQRALGAELGLLGHAAERLQHGHAQGHAAPRPRAIRADRRAATRAGMRRSK
jgi:hypothetical protein